MSIEAAAKPTDWRETYARWMQAGVRIGLVALVGSFALYVLGVLPSHLPPARLPEVWNLPVGQYLARTGAPSGWAWIARLGQGDVLNMLGVAILSSVTIACYLRVLLPLLRARDRVLAAIAAAQIVVMLVAATGWWR
jgi:Mg/Co/Ni transporter MgtE